MKLRITFSAIILGLFTFCNNALATVYTTKSGYEIELYWKVKHKRILKIWGAVKDRKDCERIELNIKMKHNDGWYERFHKTYNVTSIASRVPFNLEEEHYSKTLPKSGWYPSSIEATCEDSF